MATQSDDDETERAPPVQVRRALDDVPDPRPQRGRDRLEDDVAGEEAEREDRWQNKPETGADRRPGEAVGAARAESQTPKTTSQSGAT